MPQGLSIEVIIKELVKQLAKFVEDCIKEENFEEEIEDLNDEKNLQDDLQSWNEQECYDEDDEDNLYNSPFDQIEPIIHL
jgi:protease II